MKRIFTTTLRLDMTDEEDRLAWSHLQQMDKKQYRSYSKAIVAAVNDYFGRQEQLAADPYLETREKEDAFLQRIESTICNALRFITHFFIHSRKAFDFILHINVCAKFNNNSSVCDKFNVNVVAYVDSADVKTFIRGQF